MLDLSYFQNQNSNVQGFFNGGTWQTWIKPRGAKMVNIICQGSGAGGGGGFQSAGTKAGGGSGGSGATARLTIDAKLLPDIFYVLPGIGGTGGLGGAPATSGSSGQNSFITLIPNTGSVSNVILRSGTTPSTGGSAGTTTSTAGAAETISVIANNIFANLGTFTFQAGVIGQAGWTTVSVAGLILYKPTLMLYGGRGAGGATSGNGGNGGNGAPGCGGGGGGGSVNIGVNAGNGGNGGDGFVIITTS